MFALVEPWLGEVVMLGLDDTLCRKGGLKMFGGRMHDDPLLSAAGSPCMEVPLDPIILVGL